MQLFYAPELQADQKEFFFDREESKHIIKVLRKKTGDILHVTNGLGVLFELKITLESEKKCATAILSTQHYPKPDHYIHLAVAPTKMNERFEWFLEKATEMGIQEITPIICDHSERKVVKTERFEKIIQSAMKQSLQFHLPLLNKPISLKEFLKGNFDGHLYIAHCEDGDKKLLKNSIPKHQKYTLLIGPEGDFSKSEIEAALKNNFQAVSLGNTRLRTETAAVVACHSFVYTNEE